MENFVPNVTSELIREVQSERKELPVQVILSHSKAAEVEKEENPVKQIDTGVCHHCSKTVGIRGFLCDCGLVFCSKDRVPERHNCTFDFKEQAQKDLAQKNQAVASSKINQI